MVWELRERDPERARQLADRRRPGVGQPVDDAQADRVREVAQERDPRIVAAPLLPFTGELLFVAASWGLSVPLMPTHSPGEYQGVFATGEAAALMAAPVLMTTLIANLGQPGWLILGAIFLIPALTARPTTRWAIRTRTLVAGRP